MEILDVALNIRRIRQQKGLTLEKLATAAGVTKGLLSQVENIRVMPSLPLLYKLAGALEVEAAAFLAANKERRHWVLTRAGEGVPVEREHPESGFRYQALAREKNAKVMEPFLLTIPPHGRRAPVSTQGDEFIHLLRGELVFHLGEESVPLKPGDSLYFEGQIPHWPENPAGRAAELLVVYAIQVG
ncbi:MAG: helix-turn-helix transcriptional regulator [Spirochaetes bacterium]|nr:helix-turn-helix transcriptional regulator [Spirochaetota bacterium]